MSLWLDTALNLYLTAVYHSCHPVVRYDGTLVKGMWKQRGGSQLALRKKAGRHPGPMIGRMEFTDKEGLKNREHELASG